MSITTIARRFALGLKQGVRKEKMDFWDEITNGNPINCNLNSVIMGGAWKETTFDPPYKLKPQYASSFGNASDFVNFDTSLVSNFEDCQNLSSIFTSSQNLQKLVNTEVQDGKGRIYFNKAGITSSGVSGVLNSCLTLVDAGIMILNDNGNYFVSTGFGNDPLLEEIRFEGGYILKLPYSATSAVSTSFVASTNLSHDSIVSIVNALSPNATNGNVCFSVTAVNKAFETSEGADDGSTSQEWQDLVSTKTNWSFILR